MSRCPGCDNNLHCCHCQGCNFTCEVKPRHSDLCSKCLGRGGYTYPSTATWRGGLGGASMTYDVCDKCWGSGDWTRPWTDLRKLKAEEDERVIQRAAGLFANRLAIELKILRPAFHALCRDLDKYERKRKDEPYGVKMIARALANLLRELTSSD